MIRWLLSWSKQDIKVGNRVMTPYGVGTVNGVGVRVDLDKGSPLRQRDNRVNITVELDKLRSVP